MSGFIAYNKNDVECKYGSNSGSCAHPEKLFPGFFSY